MIDLEEGQRLRFATETTACSRKDAELWRAWKLMHGAALLDALEERQTTIARWRAMRDEFRGKARQQLWAYCGDLEARKTLGVMLCVATDQRASGIVCCDEATTVEWARGLAELVKPASIRPEGTIEHALLKLALAACWAVFKEWHLFRPEAGRVDALLKNCDAFLADPSEVRRTACEIPSPSCQPKWSWGLSREICHGGPAGGMADAYTEDIFTDAAEDGGLDTVRAGVLEAVLLW